MLDLTTPQQEVKLRVEKYKIPATLLLRDGKIFFKFRYNKILIAEIKAMQGARWHGFEDPPIKLWSIPITGRNIFQLRYMLGENVYSNYDGELPVVASERPTYDHQLEMIAQGLTRHYVVFACEMGTGKTLAAIEIMESIPNLEDTEAWYIGPKSGVKAVNRELIKWASRVHPQMYTYEQLVKRMKNWVDGDKAPRIVIFDESSKVKNPNAQRSKAAYHLAESIRSDWGKQGYVILMSGTPAPKTPVDWWHQCEVACPGFLREGSIGQFKKRLCIIEERESIAGGVYPHVVTWLDDAMKCATCGEAQDNHTSEHGFKKSKNEVHHLYKRLQGLVLVKFKKDCLDLPEKQYEEIQITPTVETLRAARLITETSPRAIQALTLLRELSDGFQYKERADGTKTCPECHGSCKVAMTIPVEQIDPQAPNIEAPAYSEKELLPCSYCNGTGSVPNYVRVTDEVFCPKDEYFINELDAHEECGRYIVWGGFTGTIDRLIRIAQQNTWATLRVDGRGYVGEDALGNTIDSDIFLDAMDLSHPKYSQLLEEYPKLCFVGHPQAGGMALTLTASPTSLYFSNSFDGTARPQSEDRFHRAGMDLNRACTIKDFIHLPSDKLVLENLKQKKRLQNLSMGELKDAFVLGQKTVSRNY